MAFREVDPGPAPEVGNFHKFNAIGDRLAGVFLSYEKAQGKYGPEHRYTFKNKEGVHTVTANFDLKRRLEKADLKPGYKVIIQYVADIPNQDPTKSAMRQFKVLVDDDVKAQPKPDPKPAADDLDDIPF